MQIRPMLIEDAPAVALIHTRTWQHAYRGILHQQFLDSLDLEKRTQGWRNGMQNNTALIRLVAEEDGGVIGFVAGLDNREPLLAPESDAELWAIYVHPEKMGKGAGKKLFAAFKDELKNRGKKRFCLWVLCENHSGRRFYEMQGGILGSALKKAEIGGKEVEEVVYEFAV
ncbi:MAG: N-acetyltransferase family protein [Bdellovibrionota bacterium]